jgi:glyoxylase-like metal-dependent hydrolase (beta-lactamase superfamily II)
MTLDAGSHRIELRYHGPNHQDGNTFIYLPRQRVLMLVDVVVPGWVPFHALGGATDVAGYLDAHDAALSYAFDTLVAGHLTRTGTASDVRVQREYLDEVRRACTQARQSVDPGGIAAATGTEDKWRFASAYFNHLADLAASEVLPRWAGRLGGTAAFTHSHCLAMTIALAHEWGVEAG